MPYKKTNEIGQLTSELIMTRGDIIFPLYLVRKEIIVECPIDNKKKNIDVCSNCKHNFGDASKRDVYCNPKMERKK